jgi:hypothetical protein
MGRYLSDRGTDLSFKKPFSYPSQAKRANGIDQRCLCCAERWSSGEVLF